MDQYVKVRSELLDLNSNVSALISQGEVVLGSATSAFMQWRHVCTAIERQLMDHVVRVAVVGAIKSGKSTLVNAFLRNDYLKRGAGVVTSIVTRIRKGEKLCARLFLKSWDEINAEMQQALVLFPSEQWQPEHKQFDIRRKQDRADLTAALASLDVELRIAQDQLNANDVLLTSYLKGFEQIESLIEAESAIQEFDAERFADHRDFVGNDALAVYLKDIELEIAGDVIAGNIEMADCQGSDSPNPLHMAMIQDYLLKAHLILYVISSRTGVRQADIRFLSMIKKMGIGNNMLFVCNCDLNEHADLNELQTLVQRMKAELNLIIPNPELFAVSALYNLFIANKPSLAQREKDRLSQWGKCKDLIAFSNDETERLESILNTKLSKERSSLLLHNQLERLDVMISGLNQWIYLNRDLMRRDAGEAGNIVNRLRENQTHILQVQSMIQSTLEGAVQTIKKDIRKKIDSFFDTHSGPILKKVVSFIRHHEVDLSPFSESLVSSGFTQTLYLVFQTYKQGVDAFMAEKINPEIIGFIGQEEVRLLAALNTVAEPYETMVRNTLAQFKEALAQFGLDTQGAAWAPEPAPDLESIRQVMGLSLPPAAATMRYSAHIKTDAVMHLGFYALVRVVRKVLKKPLGGDNAEQLKALQDGLRRIKRETERSVLAHFKDYQENVKFQYMMRLVDTAGRRLYETLTEHYQGYMTDLKELVSQVGSERTDKEKMDSALGAIAATIETVQARIKVVRENIIRLHDDPKAKVLQGNTVDMDVN